MQDVIGEAGLSVGAVYRYFKSKDEIIEAIAEQYASAIGGVLATVVANPDRSLVESMQAAIGVMDANSGPDGPIRIAVQVWAEAVRDAHAAATAKTFFTRFRQNFVRLARRAVTSGELPADANPEAIGAVLFSTVMGYGLQRVLTGSPSRGAYATALGDLLARPRPEKPHSGRRRAAARPPSI